MLDGKKILLTGSNGGIGNQIAKLLIKNNAKVILCYNKNRENLDSLVEENMDKKKNIQIQKLDLTKEKDIDRILKKVLKISPIDIFIHSPTFPHEHKDIMKTEWNDIQKIYKNHQNPVESYCFLGYFQTLFNFGWKTAAQTN